MYVWNSSCIIQIDHYIAIVCEIRGTLYRFSPRKMYVTNKQSFRWGKCTRSSLAVYAYLKKYCKTNK